jgi:hypothetical protein
MRTERPKTAAGRVVASESACTIGLAWAVARRHAMLLVRKARDIRETHGRVPPMVSHLLHDDVLGEATGEAPVPRLSRRPRADGGFTGALLRDDGA